MPFDFEFLRQADHQLLRWISTDWVNPWADMFFLFITDFHKRLEWSLALLLIVLLWLFWSHWRRALVLLSSLVIVVAASDLFCYRVLKKNFDRPRPQDTVALAQSEIRVLGRASGPGWPSNHTSNCFAAAVVLAAHFPRRRHFFYILAGIIGYSRIYLGVHFPSDVITGALIGLFVGFLFTRTVLPRFARFSSRN